MTLPDEPAPERLALDETEPDVSARRTPDRVLARASAKVNLCLGVGPRRADGYHDLLTVFTAVDLHDDVEVGLLPSGSAPRIEVHGEGAGEVPLDGRNLALRAVHLLAQETGHEPCVEVVLRKGIPVAGGLAGGSADAAAALVACDALWGTQVPRERLQQLAARLGSDVPFAVHGGTALGTGRGEHLTPVLERGRWHWVLALADGGLSTPAVYAELDRSRERPGGPPAEASDPEPVLAALRSGDPEQLGACLVNDLQPAALELRPALADVLRAADAGGALGAVVSGSGPTVVALAPDARSQHALAAALEASGTCRRVVLADGPASGARVVPVPS